MEKINLFIDADDTVLDSSKTIIDILNNRYDIKPPKTIENLKDWNYLSIYEKLHDEEILNIYDSDLFFENVKINEQFEKIYKNYKDYFVFNVVTKGSWTNLKKKEEYFKKYLPDIVFYGIPFYFNSEKTYSENYDKSAVCMKDGIQIDDRIDCLCKTNASCKIILKNGKDFYWNDNIKNPIENLYVANDWNDVEEYLKFTISHPDWLNF